MGASIEAFHGESLTTCISELEQAGYQAFMLSQDTEDSTHCVAEAIKWSGEGDHIKRGGCSYQQALHAICLAVE